MAARLSPAEKKAYIENIIQTIKRTSPEKVITVYQALKPFKEYSEGTYRNWVKDLYGETLADFLTARGVLMTDAEKLTWAKGMLEKLKKRYAGQVFTGSYDDFQKETKDMSPIIGWLSHMCNALSKDAVAHMEVYDERYNHIDAPLWDAGILRDPTVPVQEEKEDSVSAECEETDGRLHIYRAIERFDTDRMLLDVYGSAAGEVHIPRDKQYKAEINGKTFYARTYIARSKEWNSLGEWGGDAIEGIQTMLTKEEVEAMYADQKYSELIVSVPLFRNDLPGLSAERRKKRADFFYAVMGMLLTEEGMADIMAFTPKKKDGTFVRNRVVRIASNAITRDENELLYLYGKVTDDDTISIYLKTRTVGTGELEYLENDYISTNYQKYGLEKYLIQGE